MTKIKHYGLLLMLTLVVWSCTDETTGNVERRLDVNTEDVIFTIAGGSKVLEVTTDETNGFDAIWNGKNWGRIEISNGTVTIDVDANSTNEAREAVLNIFTTRGNISKTIKVIQRGAVGSDGSINLSKNRVDAYYLAKLDTVYINSTDKNFTIEVPTEAASWLSVRADANLGKIFFDIKESDSKFIRKADIKVKIAGKEEIVKVTQEPTLYYVMPYLKLPKYRFGPNPLLLKDLIDIEKGRDLKYLGYFGWGNTLANFQLPEISQTVYERMCYGIDQLEYVFRAEFDIVDIEALTNDKDFEKFMEDYGFVYMFTEPLLNQSRGGKVWWHPEYGVDAILASPTNFFGEKKLWFMKHPDGTRPDNPYNQKFTYETFESLPEIGMPWTSTREDVIKHNAELGYKTYMTGFDGNSGRPFVLFKNIDKPDSDSRIVHKYSFQAKTGTLVMVEVIYADNSKGLFRLPHMWYTDWAINNEVRQLAIDKGYKKIRDDVNYSEFYKGSTETFLTIKSVQWVEIQSANLLTFQWEHMPTEPVI